MPGRFMSAIFALALLMGSICLAEVRLARVEGNELLLTVLDDEGSVKSAITCTPKLPEKSRLDFNSGGKGILFELDATNHITPQTESIISNLTLTYELDLLGVPGVLFGGKVEFATRNFLGDKVAVLMQGNTQLRINKTTMLMTGKKQIYVVDNNFKILGIVEGNGIQRATWSCVSDKLAFWQRGTNAEFWVDDFSLDVARISGTNVDVVSIAQPGGGLEPRWERNPPIWNAMDDMLWCDPYTNFCPQSHLVSITDDRVETNVLPARHRIMGAIPESSSWYILVSGKEGILWASRQGEIISELGPSRDVYRAISTNLFLTSEIGPPPKNLRISKPGWVDVGTIPFGHYWLINSAP